MDKREMELSVATGYTITVGLSENARLPEGRTFESLQDFESALTSARSAVGLAAYTKVNFTLRTADGRVSYQGRYDLEATETPDVVAHVMEVTDHTLALAPLVKDAEARITTKLRALTVRVLWALIKRVECDAAMACARAEIAVLDGEVVVDA